MPSPFPNLPPYLRGAVHAQLHASRVLRDNPWKDPSERDLFVYLPPGYEHGAERYPAIVFLAGFTGTGESFFARRLTDPSMPSRCDRLIEGGCPPFIGVFPDCMTSLGGSQFVDSPGLGMYASYLVHEVRPFVAGRYRTSGAWGVVGHSSGGFGALHLAMNHPGAFQAVACHAGDMGFDLCYLGDLSRAPGGIASLGGLDAFVKRFWELPDADANAFAAMNVLAMSAAYSPDPTRSPIPARLPLDPLTGEVDFAVLQSWHAMDPLGQIEEPAKAQALSELRLLSLDAGDRDEYNLHLGARRFVAKLQQKGVPHRYEEFKGGHKALSRRYDISLPALAAALG